MPAGQGEVIKLAQADSSIAKKMLYPEARELAGIAGYLNTNEEEIRIADLIGKKVILIDFWTYSCINCQRTLPYLTSWYNKYRDQGLEIIGVHTPEFEFEKVKDNVQAAINKWGIEYPVAQDNDFATWRAYGNQYWPRKYLIDIDGYITYDHIGEGGYAETEHKIQIALKERAQKLDMKESIAAGIVEVKSDLASGGRVQSPETYFGAWRNERYAGEKNVVGVQTMEKPDNIKSNTLYLIGGWNIQEQYAQSASADAKVIFKYNSQDVFLVGSSEEEKKLNLLRDGLKLGQEAGLDVVDGEVRIKEDKLYRLIEDNASGEHILEIFVPQGVQFYAFTFG